MIENLLQKPITSELIADIDALRFQHELLRTANPQDEYNAIKRIGIKSLEYDVSLHTALESIATTYGLGLYIHSRLVEYPEEAPDPVLFYYPEPLSNVSSLLEPIFPLEKIFTPEHALGKNTLIYHTVDSYTSEKLLKSLLL